jgi:hypothetical protein
MWVRVFGVSGRRLSRREMRPGLRSFSVGRVGVRCRRAAARGPPGAARPEGSRGWPRTGCTPRSRSRPVGHTTGRQRFSWSCTPRRRGPGRMTDQCGRGRHQGPCRLGDPASLRSGHRAQVRRGCSSVAALDIDAPPGRECAAVSGPCDHSTLTTTYWLSEGW